MFGGGNLVLGGQVDMIKKVASEQRYEKGEGQNQVAALGKSIPGRGNNLHETSQWVLPGLLAESCGQDSGEAAVAGAK